MEISFVELRQKVVVNIADGKNLGHIIDAIFDDSYGKLLGFVVPGLKRGFFKSQNDIFIPYQHICKIGIDVILVELLPSNVPPPPPPPKGREPQYVYCQDVENEIQITDFKRQ